MKTLTYFKQRLSCSKVFNRLLQILPRHVFLLKPLKFVIIQPANLCNLHCLFCTQDVSARPKGAMSLEKFNELLSLLPPSIEEVQLYQSGEPLLNKDLPAMVEKLKNRGIKVSLSSNGTLPFERYKKVMEAGLDTMIISFDGATKESYEIYRRGGNFETVVENLKKMSAVPRRKTKIVIQFIVMHHNEHEVELMKKLAKDVGADELDLKSVSLNIGCSEILEKDVIANAKNFLPNNPKYSRYFLEENKLTNKDRPLSCPWIFRATILWNGDVVICCADFEGDVVIGNIFREESFEKIWRSKRYQLLRRKVLRHELGVCKNCSMGDNPIKERIEFNKN
jgi:radical SAM protein with 4Fe4S-binding SPASM domain